LNETNAHCVAGPFENRLHQASPNAAYLNLRINGNRSETTDSITFVKEVRADDLTIALSDETEYRSMIYAETGALNGNVYGGKMRRKTVTFSNPFERFVNNASTTFGIG
jgi:hypothetical protein